MTSDFGADIFDEEPPVPPPPPPPAKKAADEPFEMREVVLRSTPPPSKRLESELVFADAPPERADVKSKDPGRRREPERESPRPPRRGREPSDREERTSRDRPRRDERRERDRPRRGPERERDSERESDSERERGYEPRREHREDRPRRDERRRGRHDQTRRPDRPERGRRPETEDTDKLARWTPRHAAPPDKAKPIAEPGQRLAILIDYAGLQESAHRLGGEISFRRILKHIAGERPLIRAVCYVPQGTAEAVVGPMRASGFEVFEVEDSVAATVATAVDGMALAARVDCIVLAPGTASMTPLARALSATGIRVETASFEGASPMPGQHRRLGRDCVFVP